MFDLFRSRTKAVRYLLGGLLLLVALSMVVTLIPGYGTMGGADDNVVAEIGDEVLTTRDVSQRIQGVMRNRQIPREMVALYVPQMIDSMITERAIALQARKLGFRVTEEEMARTIRAILPQLFQDGKFAGNEIYSRFLEQQNLTIPEFEADLRRNLLLSRLQGMVTEGVVVSNQEIESEFRNRNEKVKLEYFEIAGEKLRDQVNVTPEEIAKYYQANRAEFTVPEKRSLDIIIADQQRVPVTVTEQDMQQFYQVNQDQFRTPERVQARHILLTTTGKSPEEVAKIQARAEELLKQVKGGANFADLAKKNSDDPGSKEKGGDLGWVVRGQTVPAFEAAAFALKPNEISNLVKTEYGFHIIQGIAKEDARMKPYEEAKSQIVEELRKQRSVDAVQRLADNARDQLAQAPGQAQQIAEKLGLQFVRVDRAGQGDQVPEIGVNREFEDAVAGLGRGGVSGLIQVGPEKLAVAAVREVQPARPAELAEVQAQIRTRLADERLAGLLEQRAKQALEKARAAGDLKAVAKEFGAEVRTTQDFARNGAADGIGSASLLTEAFEKPEGSIIGPVPVGNQRFIARVVAKTPADMSQLAAQRDQIRQTLRQEKGQLRYQLFQDSVRGALIKEGDVKIHKEVVDRIAGSYRG
jgi:peptidyl-prolyl cis-trans isomerase D